MNRSNYDPHPSVAIPGGHGACVTGWDGIAQTLAGLVASRGARRTVVVVECYTGVAEQEVALQLGRRLGPVLVEHAAAWMLDDEAVDRLVSPFLGGDDPVFGFLGGLTLDAFFDRGRIREAAGRIERVAQGLVLVVGCGAGLGHPGDVLIYADLARWEAQGRFRRNETGNLGASNRGATAAAKYKRAYFVDWRVCDRWKRRGMARWDYLLDTHDARVPKLVAGDRFRQALAHVVTRPFRVVPFFDPAPWGGQWMRERFGVGGDVPNLGWCFDGVPEENSLVLGFGEARVEVPSLDLVFAHPRELLGEAVHARFGDEFPIRFDLLDTMGGGNLSFQVHPLTEFIQSRYGMHYTQDESYYLLDAGPDAAVYLGLREGVDAPSMMRELAVARAGDAAFDVDRFAQRWPARRHDHFLIPAGTVHCSGADSMVLEISATPYIFTFKLWDWGRMGLDGKPRPIHLEEGLANIAWDRTTDWVRRELVNRVDPMATGPGWREERTGLHAREFIESRRHWFRGRVPHRTDGGVQVLNLVQGTEAVVESPDGAFEPMVVHHAETFIVPAAVGAYTLRPVGQAAARGAECATVRASVRTGLP